jgi:tetratricopeptide (TPR) repeat protein
MTHRSIAIACLSLVPAVLAGQTTSRGAELFAAHDRAGARTEFLAALQRDNRNVEAHHYLGRLALIDEDSDGALDHLESAARLDPTSSKHHYWHALALGQQATRVSTLKRPVLARRFRIALERSLALDARNIDARDLLVDFYSMAPGFMGGSDEKAREQIKAIAAMDARRGHFAAGRMAASAKDTATAERELNAAIELAPDSLAPYLALINFYVTVRLWPKAFATIERYAARRPDDLHGSYQVGRIAALSQTELERGERALRAFVAAPPRDAAAPALSRAYLRLGQVLRLQGKTADARAAFDRALELNPRNEEARKARQ